MKAYFEKDLWRPVFRTLKTSEEMEPVRHRFERRVRVYIFVCVCSGISTAGRPKMASSEAIRA